MKNVKLSLFVLALTLAVVIPSGVYASEKEEAKAQNKKSVTQKIASRDEKTKQWDEKFIKNHADNEELSNKKIAKKDEKNKEWAKKYTENHDGKGKYGDAKIELTAEQKAVIQAKKAEVEKMEIANKALEAKISADKELVKAELARIEAAKLVIPSEVQTKIDEVIVPEVFPVVEVTPVVEPVVEGTPEVVPVVEETYFEKLQAKFEAILVDLTTKNTELTSFSDKILNLLKDLNLIQIEEIEQIE